MKVEAGRAIERCAPRQPTISHPHRSPNPHMPDAGCDDTDSYQRVDVYTVFAAFVRLGWQSALTGRSLSRSGEYDMKFSCTSLRKRNSVQASKRTTSTSFAATRILRRWNAFDKVGVIPWRSKAESDFSCAVGI